MDPYYNVSNRRVASHQAALTNTDQQASSSASSSSHGARTSNSHLLALSHLGQDASTHPAIRTVTPDDIRQTLNNNGFSYAPRGACSDQHIIDRLISMSFSPDNYLCAINILATPEHPIKNELKISEKSAHFILYKLAGIVRNSGMTSDLKMAAQDAQNNPRRLLMNLLRYT